MTASTFLLFWLACAIAATAVYLLHIPESLIRTMEWDVVSLFRKPRPENLDSHETQYEHETHYPSQ